MRVLSLLAFCKCVIYHLRMDMFDCVKHVAFTWTFTNTWFSMHLTLCTSHFTLNTWHCTLDHSQHFPLHTSHFKRCAFNTPHFWPQSPHFTLRSPHFSLHTSDFTLCSSHYALRTSHLALHTWSHSKLRTAHFTLHSNLKNITFCNTSHIDTATTRSEAEKNATNHKQSSTHRPPTNKTRTLR